MNTADPLDSAPAAANGPQAPMNTAPNVSASHPPQLPKTIPGSTTAAPMAQERASTSSAPDPRHGTPPMVSQFSASTTELLERLRATSTHGSGSAAFEAKKAEVLKNYVTSDKLPTPPPIASSGRRGRGGGRGGTPSTLKTELGTASPVMGGTPTSARGSGRGRGRGRGRGGGGRGGKRKRSEDAESGNDSDISDSYTPLPTKTKSGRNVNKPVAFVPVIPEPSQGVKRRRSTKTLLAAQCKTCHRGTDAGNNRIVFCDVCSTAYHQYCHSPPIDNEVVNVLEKEWLCGPCGRAKQSVEQGMEGLVAGEGLSIESKRAYLATLPQSRLVSLLLHATIRHPELPIFPPGVKDLIPQLPETNSQVQPKALGSAPRASAVQTITSPQNGIGSTSGTPRSQPLHTDSSDMDPAEAQLLGEMRTQPKPYNATSAPVASIAGPAAVEPTQLDEYDDGYDTDPPAHYPKAGQGLARTLRPESEDLQWLVDDNFEVFSHGWKGDGTGVGADAVA